MDISNGFKGIAAAARQLDAAAFEIARASTQRSAQGTSGLSPGAAGLDAGSGGVTLVTAPSDVDLPRTMLDLMVASNAVMANLQSVKRTDEAMRSLFASR
jgi:flagellar basal body rod protein FlgC